MPCCLYGVALAQTTQSDAPGPWHDAQLAWHALQLAPTPNVPSGQVAMHDASWKMGRSSVQLVQLDASPKHVAHPTVALHAWQTPRPTDESRYIPNAHAEVQVPAAGSKE